MNDHFLYSPHPEAENLSQRVLPSQKQWSRLESNRQLLEPRKQIISTAFRLLAIGALLPYAPLILVCIWAALIFGASHWMRQLIVAYSEQLKRNPNPSTMTMRMSAIVRRYKMAWLVNSFIWGSLSFLAQFWLPDANRLACLVILNALMYLSITRTCVDRWLMHRVTATLIITEAVFVLLRYVTFNNSGLARVENMARFSTYLFYFLLMAYLLWVVGNRFNQMHKERLDFEYSKLQLIETLRKNQELLHIEQQALISANKLVQQFYSGAAHDLRQPVYAMQLYTSMLAEDPVQSDVLLPKIAQSCVSINDMFNTLFDYQQAHMYDTELVEKEINIQDTFKSLTLHFQPIAAGKDLEIRFKPICGSITMVPLYMVRILSNLIANALRYTHKGGVLVAVRKSLTNISFEVWDTGIGIEDSKTKHIFNEFYKVNKLDLSNDGLGLGLAITRQLSSRIEKSEIEVKSRVGRGSVFRFSVPISRYTIN